ncbi:hypothetical protein LEP1GSC175_2428 [Leptospira santarosai str. HAI821]|uniref:Yip1 domain-containing protein n=1 Tax=Leptospira santarosai str. MOR084 TaxID=1049984 RepID=A0A0E2BF17_9LEPT|nr:hypothetical protein [Leptospira santarosai]EKO33829.1 hypothetical protein LEP1GSC179_2910 [Leptospira santarosai str. MOR084]EMO33881.1 hypothetical protein LEP1GSC175_2428 [Leptospira santarosai str. HAI821]
MKDLLNSILGLLEAAIYEPIRLETALANLSEKNLNFYSWIVLIPSALSISVGATYLSPPYTGNFMGMIGLAFLANLSMISVLPMILGAVIDFYAQRKQRTGNVHYSYNLCRFGMTIFIFFTPISVLFREIGLTGGIGYFSILLFLIGYYIIVVSKGIQFIYDLKTSDAVRFSLTAVLISGVFPFIFYFYISGSILHLIL